MLCAVDPDGFLNFIGIVVLIVSIIGCHRIYDSKGRKGGALVGFAFGPLGFVLACLVKPVKRDPRLDGLQVKKAIKYPIVPFVLILVGLILIFISYYLLFAFGIDGDFLGFLILAGLAMFVSGVICHTVAVVRQTSRRRADAGNAQCQYNVAVAILNGEGNVFKTLDTSLAIGYLKRSAEQGYQPAIAAIGEIRQRGVDVGFVAHARVCNAPINPETGASLTEDELEKRRADGHPVDRCRQELTDEDVFCPACGAETSPANGSTPQVDAQSVAPRKKAVSWGRVAACIMLFLFGMRLFFNYQKKKDQENLDGLLNFNKRQTDAFLNFYKRHSFAMSDSKDTPADSFIQRKSKQREWAEKATEIMGFEVSQTDVDALSHSELRKVFEALVRCENAFQKIDEEIQEYYREQQHGSSRYTDYLDGLEASLKELDQAIESFMATKAPVSHGSMTVTQATNRLEQGLIDVARSELKQFGVVVRICRKNLESDLATYSLVTYEIFADPDCKAVMTDESQQTFLQNWVKVCKAVDYNPLAGE